jgi:SnoaL-like domain
MTNTLHPIIAQYIAALNAFDTNGIVATFADDAFVNDVQREFWGSDAIRRWVEKELVGDKVTMEVREVVEHYGQTIVRGAIEGNYDKTNLPPGDLILSNYFTVANGKIVSLIVIANRPAAY